MFFLFLSNFLGGFGGCLKRFQAGDFILLRKSVKITPFALLYAIHAKD